MKSNPAVLTALIEMANREVGVLLNNGKTVRGVVQQAEMNTLILLRTVRIEPTDAQVQEMLVTDPKAEIQVGEIRSKLIIPFEEIVCIEGEVFSNLRPYAGYKEPKSGDDKRGTSKAVEDGKGSGSQAGPAPNRSLPSTPGDAIPT